MAQRSGWIRRGGDDGMDRAAAERLLSDIIESTDTEIAVVDRALTVVTANAPFRDRVTGGVDPSGRALAELDAMAAGAMADVLAAVRSSLEGRTEVRMYTRDATPRGVRWLDVTAAPTPSGGGAIVRARDVTDLVENARRAVAGRVRDARTGTLGPDSLARELADALTTLAEGVLCVARFDIDQVALVRSAVGDTGADDLVAQITAAVRRQLPPRSVVGRADDDGLVAVFRADDDLAADEIVSALRDAARQPVTVSGRTMRVTASIGFDVVHHDDAPRPSAGRILAVTEDARLEAGRRGGNRILRHAAGTGGSPDGVLRLWNELRSALQFRQMEVWFQPIVTLSDGRPIAAEALVRWHHPQLGDVAPADFIPSAERNSEIIAIGSFVHDRTAHVMRMLRSDSSLRTAGLQLTMNCAADELAWPQFASSLLARLESNEVQPSWFSLEVSERIIESGDDEVLRNLQTLSAAGVTLALDDFGAALPSLPRLVDLGVRRVKLPRVLVASMTVDWRVDQIVRSLVALAQALGLETVASGVETEATAMRLREFGCHAAQGYLFSPAIPEIELPTVLRDLGAPRV